jgi:hypothetical protein
MQATENAVLANFYLREVIEQAGYIGCLSLKNSQIVNHTKNIIKPFEISSNEQSITISNLSTQSNYLLENNRSSNYLFVNKYPLLHEGDTVMISSCERAEIFKINAVSVKNEGQLIYSQQNLSAYHTGDFLGLWLETQLFTDKTARKTSKGLPIYALYLQQNQKKEELIENIKGLHFQISSSSSTAKSDDEVRSLRDPASKWALFYKSKHWANFPRLVRGIQPSGIRTLGLDRTYKLRDERASIIQLKVSFQESTSMKIWQFNEYFKN